MVGIIGQGRLSKRNLGLHQRPGAAAARGGLGQCLARLRGQASWLSPEWLRLAQGSGQSALARPASGSRASRGRLAWLGLAKGQVSWHNPGWLELTSATGVGQPGGQVSECGLGRDGQHGWHGMVRASLWAGGRGSIHGRERG